MQLQFANLPSLRMSYVEAGDPAGWPVLLLHGFPEFHHSWRHQIPVLAAAGLLVIAPDQRGYNQSSKHGPFTLKRLTLDIAELQDALGIAQCDVVGHDWGGVVAYEFAHRFPARVHKLAILNVPHLNAFFDHLRGPNRATQLKKSNYINRFQVPILPERALVKNNAALVDRIFRGVRGMTPADLALYKQAWQQPGAAGAMIGWYRALMRQVLVWGLKPPMRTLAHPVRVIWGMNDLALEFATNDTLPRYAPNAEIHKIEGAGHFVQMDAVEAVNALLLEWLGRAPPPRPSPFERLSVDGVRV